MKYLIILIFGFLICMSFYLIADADQIIYVLVSDFDPALSAFDLDVAG